MMPNRKKYIVIHHSLTKDGRTVSWGAIRRYHTQVLGWNDIGYHFGIERIGSDYEILMGRMPDKTGAHARQAGMNHRGIGICVVGNYDIEPPPEGALVKLVELCGWLMREYNIPSRNIIGHRDAGMMEGLDWTKGEFKTCPGKLFSIEKLRTLILTGGNL